MPNQENIDKVAALTETFKSAQCVAVADYTGLTVEKATKLRSDLRKREFKYVVAKNTLLKIAAKEAGFNGLDSHLKGQSAVAFGFDDPGALAKILFDFGKESQKLQVRAIFVEGKVYSGTEVERIAKLPSKSILASQLISTLNGPMSNLVGSLDGIIRKFVGTLDAMKEKIAN